MEVNFISNLHKKLKNTKLRLKREYNWDNEFVDAAVNEYGKFLYLHKHNPNGVIVPGKVVDKVWHDHILHTRDYIAFCKEEFGDYLNHDPKDASNDKMNDMKPTVDLYIKTFGYEPPKRFWLDDVKNFNKVVDKVSNVTTSSYTNSCCRCGS